MFAYIFFLFFFPQFRTHITTEEPILCIWIGLTFLQLPNPRYSHSCKHKHYIHPLGNGDSGLVTYLRVYLFGIISCQDGIALELPEALLLACGESLRMKTNREEKGKTESRRHCGNPQTQLCFGFSFTSVKHLLPPPLPFSLKLVYVCHFQLKKTTWEAGNTLLEHRSHDTCGCLTCISNSHEWNKNLN